MKRSQTSILGLGFCSPQPRQTASEAIAFSSPQPKKESTLQRYLQEKNSKSAMKSHLVIPKTYAREQKQKLYDSSAIKQT
jgi:hypothetical protein